MVTTKLNLSMTEPQVRQIYAKQGDTGRVLDITLDQTPEDGTLRILRPDGVEVTSEAVTGGEVSGSTFESLTEADVTELTVGIEPVQDLNGYDKPWVGGAGKNKSAQSTLTTTGGGYINYSCGTFGSAVSGQTYTLSLDNKTSSTANMTVRIYNNGTQTNQVYGNLIANGRTSWTFMASVDGEVFISGYISGLSSDQEVFKNIQLELGSTATAWQPYSNICPITGHDEVEVTDVGKNLFDVSLGQYKALNSTTGELGADNPIRFTSALTDLPDGTYTFSFGSNMFIIGIAFYDKSGNFKRYDAKNFSTTAQTFSVESEKIRLCCGSAQNHDDLADGLSVGQLELGSTATAYEPYQGNTYTTSLGQTVYGGTLDMVTGQLVVDRAIVDLGTLSWSKGNRNTADTGYVFFSTSIASAISRDVTAEAFCSAYAQQLPRKSAWEALDNGRFQVEPSGYLVFVADYSDAPTFKTALNGVQLVYKLATPVEYQLTAQQIKTLVGTNNVWASSGDIVSIKFAYDGLLSELPSQATEIVGKCYCDVEQNGVSSMPFTLNVKKNERES